MKIKVSYDKENKEKTIELASNPSVKELLAKIEINPETVIVSRNDSIITLDENLKDKDEIKLISVISGG